MLVIGGGPAGAGTALRAARAGLDVLLVDRAVFPREKACAEYLSPEAGRDLEELGVLAEVEAAGAQQLAGMRIVSDDGADVTGRFAGAHDFTPHRPYGLAVRRSVLDTILDRIATVVACDAAAIVTCDGPDGALTVRRAHGYAERGWPDAIEETPDPGEWCL